MFPQYPNHERREDHEKSAGEEHVHSRRTGTIEAGEIARAVFGSPVAGHGAGRQNIRKFTRWKIIGGVVVVLSAGSVLLDPPGRFGICASGLTTYGCIPHLVSDLQVRADGRVRTVGKTHDITMDTVQWLLDPVPDVLIVGTGWDGAASPAKDISRITRCKVRILKTGEAIRAYNRLKKQGRNVAIHVHSTC